MINTKKLFNIICLSSFLICVPTTVALVEAEATDSILATENKLSQIESQSENNDYSVKSSNNELKAEDFLDEFEVPEKEKGEDWTDELLKPEDFLSKEDVTIKDFENKVLTRMLEVVSLIQTFAKPFCIILFIICALGVLMSIVFNTNKQKMFILGLILSVITYVGVVFAPNLVLFFANWLSF